MYLNDIFTICANLTGQPALDESPCGVDDNGQPVGTHDWQLSRRGAHAQRGAPVPAGKPIGTNGHPNI